MFCTWSVRICVQNFAIVRHGVSEYIGPDKINKLSNNTLIRNNSHNVQNNKSLALVIGDHNSAVNVHSNLLLYIGRGKSRV